MMESLVKAHNGALAAPDAIRVFENTSSRGSACEIGLETPTGLLLFSPSFIYGQPINETLFIEALCDRYFALMNPYAKKATTS